MIEFIENHCLEIAYWLMLIIMVSCLIELHFRKKNYRALKKSYEELLDEHENTTAKSLAQTFELLSICAEVEAFVNEHNSWHDRKIAFYYDKDGWHCCYDDEIPQGDTFIEQEEITQQNENKDENQQSI